MNNWNALFDYLITVVTLENVIVFWVLYFFVIWISILVWVIKDIKNRSDKIYLQILSVFVILVFSPFWIFLYLLIRPSKTLFEQYYLEVEHNLECLWDDIVEKIWKKNFNTIDCVECSSPIQEEFKYCPYCKTKVKIKKKELIKSKKKWNDDTEVKKLNISEIKKDA